MKMNAGFILFLVAVSSLAAHGQEPRTPICDRVVVSFRADGFGDVDPEKLRSAQAFMLRRLADHGYSAKYVTFYAPGEPVPDSNEEDILAEAGEDPRVLVEISYDSQFFTRNLGVRIFKLNAKPPYGRGAAYNGNSQIGPYPLGARLKSRFSQLLRAKDMVECSELEKRI